jgi:hypothetical protein
VWITLWLLVAVAAVKAWQVVMLAAVVVQEVSA